MNRTVSVFILVLLGIPLFAQYSDSDLKSRDGVSIGIEKNNSVWLDYCFKKGFHICLKHTAIADKLHRQSWRMGASYDLTPKYVKINLNLFLTSDWYTSFVNTGCSFKLTNQWKGDVFRIGVEYVPYYDNDLKFQYGWAVAAQVRVHKDMSLFAEYGRKLDYRILYQRAYVGFEIKVAALYVKPMLEIPVYDSGIRFDHSKVVISTFYTFKHKKAKIL